MEFAVSGFDCNDTPFQSPSIRLERWRRRVTIHFVEPYVRVCYLHGFALMFPFQVHAMNDPTLEYESRTSTPRSRRRIVGKALAIASLFAGAGFGFVFVVGFGVGDSWVIYPPDVPIFLWAIPAALIAWPIWFLSR